MMFRLFHIARVQPLHAVIEVILGGEVGGEGGCVHFSRSPFADLYVGPGLVRDGRGRSFHRLQKEIARLKQLSLGKELDGMFIDF